MINSTSNKQVKRVSNLRDKAKARREEGVYVAEGLRMCREYKPDDVEILYITESPKTAISFNPDVFNCSIRSSSTSITLE